MSSTSYIKLQIKIWSGAATKKAKYRTQSTSQK